MKKAKKPRARVRRLNSRERWLALLVEYMAGTEEPASKKYWAPQFETASRARLVDIQTEKLRAMLPYLYEHSPFYREKFRAAKMRRDDIQSVADLARFPVTTKNEMADDVAKTPPWGSYTPIDDRTWAKQGWMVFSTSGTTTTPRSFRYTALDREIWARTSARALYTMGIRAGDTALACTNYNPHVFFCSTHYALNLMRVTVIPGGV